MHGSDLARFGRARRGRARQARSGSVWRGKSRQARLGQARRGSAWRGTARQARQRSRTMKERYLGGFLIADEVTGEPRVVTNVEMWEMMRPGSEEREFERKAQRFCDRLTAWIGKGCPTVEEPKYEW